MINAYLVVVQELRMVLVKPRSREGSVSERLCNVWLDDARDELVIVYETVKKLCIKSHVSKTFVAVCHHTQDVRGCPCVSGCPPAHTGQPWLSVAVRQHTQDVRLYPSAHTERPCVFVCVRVCMSAHTRRPWLSISTHISMLVLGLSTLAHPVDCLGDFGPNGMFVQYTQDVRGCPPAHTGRLWLSVSTHKTSVAVCVCPCVSVSTHMTSVAVHQYTYQHAGPWTPHAGPFRGMFSTLTLPVDCLGDIGHVGCLFSTHRTSVGVRQHTQDVRVTHVGSLFSTHRTSAAFRQHTQDVGGCPRLSVNTHRTSAAVRVCPCVSMCVQQDTQDVRVCPSAHTGRVWLTVCIRVCPSAHTGRPGLSIKTHISTLILGLITLTLPVDCLGDFGPRGQPVQYTQDVRGCPPAHTGRPWLTLALPVDCLRHFGPRGLSVQYTQHVRGCPPAHTGRPWQHTHNVCGCPSAHRTSLAVHQYTYQHVGPSTQHADPPRGLFGTMVRGLSTLALPVDCSGDFGPRRLSVQYTQASVGVRQHTQHVCVCPSAHTGRQWLSVCVPVCPSEHIGRPWLSINTLVLGLGMLALPMDCMFSTHRTSVGVHQHTQDVCGCLWLSVSTNKTSVAVRVCPCVSECVCGSPSAHTGRLWLSISTHISTLVLGLSTLAFPVDCSGDFGTRGLSIQYTPDVCGCPPAHTGRLWLSVCPTESVSTHRTSVAVHQYTYQHVGPWTQHAGPPRGLFGTCVAVCVCPSAHTGSLWLSVRTHRTCVDVRVCPSMSVSTHMMSVAVHQYTYQHVGPWIQHAGPSMDCLGDFGPRGLSVQYIQDVVGVRQNTQDVCGSHRTSVGCPSVHISACGLSVQYTHDVRGCPPAHTGLPWLLFSTHRASVGVRQLTQDVHGCPCVSVCVRQHTQDGRGCKSVHISARWSLDSARWPFPWTVCVILAHVGCLFSTHRMSVGVRQHTHDVHGCLWLSVSTHKTSVGVCPHTHDVHVCQSAHTGRPWLSLCVPVCPSEHTGRPWLSISTHINTLVLGLGMLALPMDCLGDFGRLGLSVQYTQDVCGCPLAHTGRVWLSVSTNKTSVAVHVCPCVSVCVRQHTQDGRGCKSVHISARWSLDTACWPFPWTVCVILAHVGCLFSTHRMSVGVRQHTQDGHGCLWLSVSTHKTSVAVLVCLCVSVSTHKTSVGVCQHTHDIHVCQSAHTGRPWLSVCVPVCPSEDTGRPWLSITTHINTTSVGVRQHTQDVWAVRQHLQTSVAVRVCPCVSECVCGRPSAHTGRLWLSISTHISTLVLGLSTLAFPVDCSGDFRTRGLSVKYTQDVRGCLTAHTGRVWLTVCIRVCPSAHTGRPGLSIKTHISMLVLGLSTLTLPMDCLGDFGPRGQSVQYTQDVRGCPPAHTGRPWACPCVSVCVRQHTQDGRGCKSVHISARWSLDSACWPFPWTVCVILAHVGCLFSTHRMSVGVRQHTQDVHGCLWLSISTHKTSVGVCQHTHDVHVCQSAHTGRRLWVSTSTHRTSVGVHQHTQDVCGCPWLSVSTNKTSVAVRVCPCVSESVCGHPSAHTGRLWLSISTHISTLVLGLSTLAFPVDCSGDFGTRGLSIQYTQDVCGCPPAHTGRLWLSVFPTESVSTHRTSVAVHQYTYQHVGPWTQHAVLPVDCLGDFGPRGLSVQYTQDVRGCSPAHTGHPWVTLALPMDCLGDFGPRGLSVQYTQDVRGCPPEHTGRLWLYVAVRQHTLTQDVCGCPSVHLSARGLSVQYTQDVRGCPPAHTGLPWLSVCVCLCPSEDTGRPWLSISTHINMLVLGLGMLTLPVDCLGDFGPRGQPVQYTQDVRGCPPAHTGRPWLSVCVCLCPSAHTGRPWLTHRMSVGVRQHTQDVHGCLWLSVSTHKTSVGVCQHTHDVHVCQSAHTGRPWLSLCVPVCPSEHTGRPWLSISTHINTLVLGLGMLALPMDCLGDFGRRGLSVQYTQDVCGCPLAHTGRVWLSVSTNKTSVAVRVCPCVSECVCGRPSAHTGRLWLSISTHISTLVLGLSTLAFPVDCSGDFGTRGLSVQYTQDVRGCPPAHTGRPWLSVCPIESVSTHRTSVAVHQYTYQHVGPWTQHAGPSRGLFGTSVAVCGCPLAHPGRPWLSVCVRQHTQDICGCPSADTGRPCVSVSTHRTCVAVRVCPSVSVSTHMMSVAVHQYTYQHVVHTRRPWVSASTHKTSVAVCGCPSAHTIRPWMSVCVRVCPCVSVSTHITSVCVHQHTGRPWLSINTHISTLVLRLSTLTLPVDCLGDFSPRGLSVQYTQDVRWCPPAHTGSPWLSVSTHRTSMLSVCVRVCPSAHTGRPWLSISKHISTLVLGLNTLTLPVDCSGDFGPCGQSVQYTQDVRGCPPAHTGRPWLSEAFRQHTQDIYGRPCVPVRVRVCPSGHTRRSWVSVSTHRTSVAVRLCLCLSVCFHQDTQDVRVCSSAHTGRVWLTVCIRVCPSAHTERPGLSIKKHISIGSLTQHADPSHGLFG
ncbi:hypothetical protein IGI04_040434 [Brassica rapa subsp. trilocularis]|uniref:Uncharacterized protein n=1 Tax=Brassica rapa subsp. trilocularis TaxID=1813537 RepID=A0ABQ7KS12_BRACM|nr:hypothetical protein IGI04_040434 [Brassica rapa subsp. trilocularis]